MDLGPLQQYCLEAMGITRYRLNITKDSYAVYYVEAKDVVLEHANRKLLDNILAALKWPMSMVKIYPLSSGSLDHLCMDMLTCVLLFGVKLEEQPGNHLLQCLPGLSELHDDVALKKKVWNQLKPFIQKD